MKMLPKPPWHVQHRPVPLWIALAILCVLAVGLWVAKAFGDPIGRPYDDLNAHTPALWDGEEIWYGSDLDAESDEISLYLYGLAAQGADDLRQAIMVPGGFPLLEFSAKVHLAGAIACPGEPSPSPAGMRLGATFDLYRSLAEDKIGATIIIRSTPEAPVTHATGWVFRCLDAANCDLGVEHVGQVDLGPVPWGAWMLWTMYWDEPSGLMYFLREDEDGTLTGGVVDVPDPVKSPLAARSIEAWATSSACPESYAAGLIEIRYVGILP